MAWNVLPCLLAIQAFITLGSCGRTCKTSPGSADWPSEDVWSHFAQALGDKLLNVPPPGAVCHPDQPTYNNASCAKVQIEWGSQLFQSYSIVSSMFGANNASCLPDPSEPCYPQGFPAYVVNASSANDVALAVQFGNYNIRLSVRAGGHDIHGQSSAPGSLEIWVSSMQNFQHLDSFQPTGCNVTIEGSAATVGAGIRMINLTRALDGFDEAFPTGGGETIALAGYATSGGHSILAPRMGLAADNVLEVQMVSPDGDVLTLNECQNTDLFWAVRGGGGGTFGVITSYTIKTYPTPPIVTVEYILTMPTTGDLAVYDVAAYLMSQFPYMESHDMTAYVFTAQSLTDLSPALNGTGVFFAAHGHGSNYTEDSLLELLAPLAEHINATWPDVVALPVSNATYSSFYEWYLDNNDPSQVGGTDTLGSRLLDAKALTMNLTAVAKAFETLASGSAPGVLGPGVTESYLISGQAVWDAKPRGGGNSVCPAWRKTLSQNVAAVVWTPNNKTSEDNAYKVLQGEIQGLRDLAPDTGVYQNEALSIEPDWQRQFWGDNYPRLLEIKRKYDPNDVFWCDPCVGNDRWEEVGYQLCQKCHGK